MSELSNPSYDLSHPLNYRAQATPAGWRIVDGRGEAVWPIRYWNWPDQAETAIAKMVADEFDEAEQAKGGSDERTNIPLLPR